MSHGSRLHQRLTLAHFLKSPLPRIPDPLGDHVHGLFQVDVLPFAGIGRTVFDLFQASGMGGNSKVSASLGQR